jgi:hypothetical protein
MCTNAQTTEARSGTIEAIEGEGLQKTMLFTIAAVLVAAGGAVMFYKARAARRVTPADLGRMSAQWLAENNGSDLS